MNTVAVVLAHNEENHLPHTLRILNKRKQQGLINHIIVVNDGSTDRTSEIARSNGAEVINLKSNLGRRLGFVEGAKAAHRAGAQAMLVLDADILYFPVKTLKQMTAKIQSGKYVALPTTLEREHGTPTEKELRIPKRLFKTPRSKTGQALTPRLDHVGYHAPILQEDFVGQRLISMNALAPLIKGNAKWMKYFTPADPTTKASKWGYETALQYLIPPSKVSFIASPIFNREVAGNRRITQGGQAYAPFEIRSIYFERKNQAKRIKQIRLARRR